MADALALKHESKIISGPCIWFKDEPSHFSMGQTVQSRTSSITEKPLTGLDGCLKILLSCLWDCGHQKRNFLLRIKTANVVPFFRCPKLNHMSFWFNSIWSLPFINFEVYQRHKLRSRGGSACKLRKSIPLVACLCLQLQKLDVFHWFPTRLLS